MTFPHVLLSGPPDIGKTTLASRIARDLVVGLQVADGTSLSCPADLIPFLTNAEQGSVILINEADSLPKGVCEFMLPAITDFRIDITLGEGINARTLNMSLRPFSLALTTTRPSKIDYRLRREAIAYDFTSYSHEEMTQIVRSLGTINGLHIRSDAIDLITSYCDGLPGKADVLVRQLRNYFAVRDVTQEVATEALSILGYSSSQPLSITLPAKVKAMTGSEFEEFAAAQLRRMGYSVELTNVTGDHGVDLLLRKQGILAVAQCKRWENAVGEPVVRDFLGSVVGAGATYGYLITTSYFTGQALAFADNRPLRLIDLDGLIHLANQASPQTTASSPQISPQKSMFDDL